MKSINRNACQDLARKEEYWAIHVTVAKFPHVKSLEAAELFLKNLIYIVTFPTRIENKSAQPGQSSVVMSVSLFYFCGPTFRDQIKIPNCNMSITLERQRSANELVHTNVTVDTRDHEDHTFAGIMFDVKAAESMPVEYIEIQSIAGVNQSSFCLFQYAPLSIVIIFVLNSRNLF